MTWKIDDFKKEVRIKNVVEHYLPLSKKGKNYWCVCPFHSDTKPSLSVSEEKNIFKCFACGVFGDGISFVMKKESLTFLESVKKIGEILNIDTQDLVQAKRKQANHQFYLINDLTNKSYKKHLLENPGIQDFLIKERGLNEEIIDFFNIGYSSHKNNLDKMFLKWNEMRPEEKISFFDIEELGILKKKDNYYSFFDQRIMFPIVDINKKIIGFSGRTTNPEETIKYLNSSESKIFKKSESLYNIQNLSSNQDIYIFEGFFDLISAHKIGFTNGVAIMGSSLSEKNLINLLIFSSKLIFCFDNDVAGIENTIISAKKIFITKNTPFVVDLLDTKMKDIDSLIAKDHNHAQKLLKNPLNFFDWYPKYLKTKFSIISQEIVIEKIQFFLSWIFINKKNGSYFLNNVSEESAIFLIDFSLSLLNLIESKDKTAINDSKTLALRNKYIDILKKIEPAWENKKPAKEEKKENKEIILKQQKFESTYIHLIIYWINNHKHIKQAFPNHEWYLGWKIIDYAAQHMKPMCEHLKTIINVSEDVNPEQYLESIQMEYKDFLAEEQNYELSNFFASYFLLNDEILQSTISAIESDVNLSFEERWAKKVRITEIKMINMQRSASIFKKLQLFLKKS